MQHTSKYTIALLAAVASLASCSENDIPGLEKATDKYIVFGTPSLGFDGAVGDFASNNTRANVTLTSSVDNFQVWAYCIPNKIKGDKDPEKATTRWVDKYMFFTSGADVDNLVNATVNPSDVTNNYNNGELTRWNDDPEALYTFIGLAGNKTYKNYNGANVNNFDYVMENASAVSGSEHGPRLTITLNPNGETITETIITYDTIPAKWPWMNPTIRPKEEEITKLINVDRTYQPDPIYAVAYDLKKEDGNVKLSFSHIMTALRFKIQNFSDKELTITSMKFQGKFYKKATIDFSELTPKMDVDVSQTYDGPFYIIDKNEEVIIEKDNYNYAGGEDNYLLLLPNPKGTTNDNDGNYVLGVDKKLEITYHFENGEEKSKAIEVKLNYLPQPNTKHTAYLNFVGDNFFVTFQADEKTWENGSDNNYIIK
ncbi:MAG: fimbrillin family protein [Muribaculaceae bacterium]|nr:fimbrillin family protein [Muribaculaceae bacterium]